MFGWHRDSSDHGRQKTSLSVGQIVLACNIIIYLIAGILFGLDRALYSLLTYFITSRIVDYINTGLDQGKAVMIITDQGRVIAEDIYKTLGRTVTFLSGEGLYPGRRQSYIVSLPGWSFR